MKQGLESGFLAYSMTLAYLFASLLNMQDATEMLLWAIGFSIVAALDQARSEPRFAILWVATIMGTYGAFMLLGPIWSWVGFCIGYLTVGSFLMPHKSPNDSSADTDPEN